MNTFLITYIEPETVQIDCTVRYIVGTLVALDDGETTRLVPINCIKSESREEELFTSANIIGRRIKTRVIRNKITTLQAANVKAVDHETIRAYSTHCKPIEYVIKTKQLLSIEQLRAVDSENIEDDY